MYPIALDLKKIPVLLVGRGEMLTRRKQQLEENGAAMLTAIDVPPPVGGRLGGGLDEALSQIMPPPPPSPYGGGSIVFVTGLTREESEKIATSAHKAGKLVNVEDVMDLCDFYFTANVKRGDLVIAVSTSGASPTLARKVRDWIATRFGEEWADYTRELSNLRKQWKNEGKDMKSVLAASEEHIAKKKWLA